MGRKYKPKIIICVGKDNASDFEKAFGDDNSKFKQETIQDRQVQKYFGSFKNKYGTLVVHIPFFYGRGHSPKTTIDSTDAQKTTQTKIESS